MIGMMFNTEPRTGRESVRMDRCGIRADRYGGWVTTEIVIALGTLLLIGSGLVALLHANRRFHADQMSRMRCLAAAQAQMDSLVVIGRSIPEDVVQHRWPGVTLQIERQAGRGDWQGLERIRVTATRKVPTSRRIVRVELVRYVDDGRAEGGS